MLHIIHLLDVLTNVLQDALDARLAGISQHHESSKTTESKLKTMNKLKASNAIKSARVNDAIEDMQEVCIYLTDVPINGNTINADDGCL